MWASTYSRAFSGVTTERTKSMFLNAHGPWSLTNCWYSSPPTSEKPIFLRTRIIRALSFVIPAAWKSLCLSSSDNDEESDESVDSLSLAFVFAFELSFELLLEL